MRADPPGGPEGDTRSPRWTRSTSSSRTTRRPLASANGPGPPSGTCWSHAPDAATGFTFVDGFAEALAAAKAEAGDRAVSIAGGADVIRLALDAGEVDELAVSVAPVVLSGGKRLFEGFTRDLDLEIRSVHHSAYAVHTTYGVLR